METNLILDQEAIKAKAAAPKVSVEQLNQTFDERKKKQQEELEADYQAQLKEFAEDTSYYDDYNSFSPFTKKVLVRIFKFVPKIPSEQLGHTTIMVESPLDGKLKPQLIADNEKVFPIVKVFKIGEQVENKTYITKGNLYVVPMDEVMGDDWNPEFMFLMNTMVQQGQKGGLAKIPEEMRQRIPRLEKNWDKYRFGMPNRLGNQTERDRLIYLIPEIKLESLFTV